MHNVEEPDHLLSAFGYVPVRHPQTRVTKAKVGESKHRETLEPLVVLSLWADPYGDPTLYVLRPDLADRVADELHHWANRARERSLNPPDRP